jgi:DNA-binding CsgD family transcriptional regulator
MRSFVVTRADIDRCPRKSLAADHYNEDGTCACPDARLRRPRIERGHPRPWSTLSPRELDVLELVAEGSSNLDIAQVLGVESRAVEQYIARARVKLGIVPDPMTNSRVLIAVEFLAWKRTQ